MINTTLLDWDYYRKKLPEYTQDSYGFQEHFSYLINLFNILDNTYDNIIYIFDIFDKNYLNWINSLDGNDEGTVSEVLDLIGELYGVSRVFDCTYVNVFFDDETHKILETYTEPLTLTNSEFLKLIKVTIIQQNFNGTYGQSREFYDSINLPIVLFYNIESATSLVYLVLSYNNEGKRIDDFTDNELKMFMAGLFTLRSVGITYEYRMGDIENVLVWDANSRMWDVGVWS